MASVSRAKSIAQINLVQEETTVFHKDHGARRRPTSIQLDSESPGLTLARQQRAKSMYNLTIPEEDESQSGNKLERKASKNFFRQLVKPLKSGLSPTEEEMKKRKKKSDETTEERQIRKAKRRQEKELRLKAQMELEEQSQNEITSEPIVQAVSEPGLVEANMGRADVFVNHFTIMSIVQSHVCNYSNLFIYVLSDLRPDSAAAAQHNPLGTRQPLGTDRMAGAQPSIWSGLNSFGNSDNVFKIIVVFLIALLLANSLLFYQMWFLESKLNLEAG